MMPTERGLKLREQALHRAIQEPFAKTIIEAEAWRSGGSKAEWLIWRARRVAAILEWLPIEIGSDFWSWEMALDGIETIQKRLKALRKHQDDHVRCGAMRCGE